MRKYNTTEYQNTVLRSRAEQLLAKKNDVIAQTMDGKEDLKSLVHELQVHQVELEMQNEALRQAQDEIEKSRNRYFDLYDFAPVGFATLDEVGLILEINLTGASLLSIERENLINRRFQLFVSSESLSFFNDFLMNLTKTQIKQTCMVKLLRQDSTLFYAQLFGEVRNGRCLIAAVDITQRKQVEDELDKLNKELEQKVIERTAQLETVNRQLKEEFEKSIQIEKEIEKLQRLESIGVLAGGIAHDFNNLLTAILGNIFLSKLYLSKKNLSPDDDVFKRLADSEDSCMHAKDLTGMLITFAKGGGPIKEPIEISKFLKETATLLIPSDLHITCEFDISDNLYPVKADKLQIKQVVKGLVANAVEAMPNGGIIRVKADNKIGKKDNIQLKEDKYIKVSIEDSGVGIPEENLSKIFDPYFSTKERGSQKGMGLGLSICHSIINRHEGLITVDSKVGVGTTFHFYLPANL